MITNFVIRSKIEALKKERAALYPIRQELEGIIRATAVSKQAAWKAKKGLTTAIEDLALETRNEAAKKLYALQQKQLDIKERMRKLYEEEEAENNLALIKILSEIFTDEQTAEIKKEAQRRTSGEEPIPLPFTVKNYSMYKDEYYKYRELAKDQLKKMVEFRIMLTGLIEQGCSQFGDAAFLKFVSPLNKMIIPLKELEKIRSKYYL